MSTTTTTAHCRSCNVQGPRAEVARRQDMGVLEGTFDVCRFCNSTDVDVMSPEGVAHEEVS